jgi:hypothetical protein
MLNLKIVQRKRCPSDRYFLNISGSPKGDKAWRAFFGLRFFSHKRKVTRQQAKPVQLNTQDYSPSNRLALSLVIPAISSKESPRASQTVFNNQCYRVSLIRFLEDK